MHSMGTIFFSDRSATQIAGSIEMEAVNQWWGSFTLVWEKGNRGQIRAFYALAGDEIVSIEFDTEGGKFSGLATITEFEALSGEWHFQGIGGLQRFEES